jgi:natural product biosynthesis luciferase-like monooxygenase protein
MTEMLEATYGLSPVQQGMLFHHLSHPRSGVDIEQIVASLEEDIDPSALRDAWQGVAERHAVLRTSFRWENVDEPVQQVHQHIEVPIEIEDWRGIPASEHGRRLAERLRADRERGFDLREAPLVRLSLVRLGERHWEMVWTFPHILLDGRSFPIVLDEVFSRYDAQRLGASIEVPSPPPYRDHVEHLARLDLAQAERFWRARLAGFRAPTPLPGSPVAGTPTGRGEREVSLAEETTNALARVARETGVSVGTLVQGAFALLLARMSGESDVVFGATRAGRATSVPDADGIVGLFIATLPVRVTLRPEQSLADWLRALRASERETRPHEHTPLVELQGWSELRSGAPLFESLLVFDHALLDSQMRAKGPAYANRRFRLHERTNYALTLYAYAEPRLLLKLAFDEPRFDADAAGRMLEHLAHLLAEIARDPAQPLGAVSLLSAAERERLVCEWNDTAAEYPRDVCVHQLIEAQAARTPDAAAIVFRDQSVCYGELNERANRLAHHLRGLGVGPDVRVGVFAERSIELMIGLLAVHKAGGAYVPLDPAYPKDRIAFMIEDSDVPVLLTQSHLVADLPRHGARVVRLDTVLDTLTDAPATNPVSGAAPAHLAYVIYTSGSTGKPKGVMVEHRNVVNFFAGMDAKIPQDGDRTWLAVTSLSFDISVLELFWTLARGFRVVLYEDERRAAVGQAAIGRHADRAIQFSLMYFASEEAGGRDQYRLLLEGAKYADAHDFAAVWTPERHFHAFGGLYPNPSVASAAIATVTKKIGLRAGSVVMPLHHPARVAEEWALVDAISGGRVGVSFASGWQPRDFVLGPDNFQDARRLMIEGIEQVRRLWRGEALSFPGPNGDLFEIKTLPRPVQPELPFWLTAAGTPETFRKAGEMGAHILTHLLGQTLDEVAERLKIYRDAWKQAGHPGEGHVTLMLHTFVGDDDEAVRNTVRRPMMDYLGSSVGLIRNFANTWTAFKKRADGGTASADLDLNDLSAEEMEGLLEYSFERYFETSALFGTTERCMAMVDRLKGLGVDEIACLIDFGVEVDRVLAHLEHLNRLRELAQPRAAAVAPASVGELIARHRVTHLQCTPSLASMLVLDEDARPALGSLRAWMIGGEAFPAALAAQIRSLGPIEILNMYGPTETTIWSSVHRVEGGGESIPIGRPIANTQLYTLDEARQPVPVGIAGELYIGGDGVTRGYLNRPELTAERFVPDPFRAAPSARLYRTGDLARWRADGVMEFLGRIDHQVKIRGHRIELGEIEAALAEHAGVREAVVIAREDVPGDVRLVAYVIPRDSHASAWTDGAVLAKQLREALRERLPETMLPAHFVRLDAFPQTPNRKIDRKALPAPAGAAQASAPADAPRAPSNDVENAIVAIWKEVLQVDRVGTEDNFFDLGGHSLLAVRAHRRLCEVLPRRVSITDLFRFPTVRALAEYVSDTGSGGPTLQQSQDRAELRKSALARRRGARGGARRDGAGEDDA